MEKPEELRCLVDSSQEAKLIRMSREFRRNFDDYLWASYRDETDIFDLRFLYDYEEIMEIKLDLIEDIETNRKWYYFDDLADEPDENNRNEVAEYNIDMLEEEETWDNDDYNVRFHYRLGFVTDDYDSGHDEPNTKRKPYPPFEEETEEDRKEFERIANMLVERHFQRNDNPVNA